MSFHDNDEYSFSVEAPVEDALDSYGYPQLLPVGEVEEDILLTNALRNLDDTFLSSNSYVPVSPLLEDGSPVSYRSDSLSPSVFEALSLDSPSSSYDLSSATSSPWSFNSNNDLTPETQYTTVAPRDIMGGTSSPCSFSPCLTSTNNGLPMEPLFDKEVDEAQSHELVALDQLTCSVQQEVPVTSPSALFGAQKRVDLHVEIPSVSSLPHLAPTPRSPASSLSPALSSSSEYLPSLPSEAYSLSPQPANATSPLPPPSPPVSPQPISVVTRSQRRLRSSSSVSDRPPRHHPYEREPSAIGGAERRISRNDFRQIVTFLQPFPEFANWDFETNGLPKLVRTVVGSKKTREASENRRTQDGGFLCTIPGCGSTITKKHNLRHHIISHYILHAFKCSVCHQGFGHHCSLVRHQRGSCRVKDEPEPVQPNKRGKRTRRT